MGRERRGGHSVGRCCPRRRRSGILAAQSLISIVYFNFFCNQAKRKERMVKEKLQKQMTSVAEQQQRLNKVRMELEKLEMVRY